MFGIRGLEIDVCESLILTEIGSEGFDVGFWTCHKDVDAFVTEEDGSLQAQCITLLFQWLT